MNKLIIPAMALAVLGASAADAQTGKGKSQKEESVIIKKDDNTKTEIVIENGRVYIDGEELAAVEDDKDGNTTRRKIVIQQGAQSDVPSFEFFNGNDAVKEGKAVLGVHTGHDGDSKAGGAAVVEVMPMSAAEKAGLQAGDRITRVNDKAIQDAPSLVEAIADYKSGDEVDITYVRDGKTETTKAKLGNAAYNRTFGFNPDALEGMGGLEELFKNFGMESPAAGRKPKLGISGEDSDGTGIRVMAVKPGSPAEKAGLKEADKILRIGDKETPSFKALQSALDELEPGKAVNLQYERNGRRSTTNLTLPRIAEQKDF